MKGLSHVMTLRLNVLNDLDFCQKIFLNIHRDNNTFFPLYHYFGKLY